MAGVGAKTRSAENADTKNNPKQRGFLHMFQDKELVCKDCGATFVFTAGEQEFYAEKGFQNEPVRCRDCRNQRKSQRRGIVSERRKLRR